MPIYRYVCQACNKAFAIKASLKQKESNDSKIFVCANCKSKDIKQDYSGINVAKNSTPTKSGCASGCCCH